MEHDLALRLAQAIEGFPPNPADISTLSAMARDLRRMGGTRLPPKTVAAVMEKHLGAEEAMEYARMSFDAKAITQAEYSAMRDYLIPRYFLPPVSQEPLRQARKAFGLPDFPPQLSDWRPGQPMEEAPLPLWLRRARKGQAKPWRTEAPPEEYPSPLRPSNPGHNPGNPGELAATDVTQRQARITEALYILRPVLTSAQAGWPVLRIYPQLQIAQKDIVRMAGYSTYLAPMRDRLLRANSLLTPDRLPLFRQEIVGIMDDLASMMRFLEGEREQAIKREEQETARELRMRAEFSRAAAARAAPAAQVLRVAWLPPRAGPRPAPVGAPRRLLPPLAGYRGFRPR